ncbi:MAG: hypothetical protein IKN38_03560 [Clostridia bacterium]|nr:hypothetical protein [Clostridia bacterium]
MTEDVETSALDAEQTETGDIAADAGQIEDAEDLDGEFERLIKGKFKDSYAKRTQNMINRRFREMKELEKFRDDAIRGEEDSRRETRAKDALGVASEYSALICEADEVKESYPSFDLEKECADPRFTKLVGAGMGIRGAYEAIHHREILASAMQYAADKVYEAARRGVAASTERPTENGVVSGAAIDPRPDVASLTERDIRDIIHRVEKGEIIKF